MSVYDTPRAGFRATPATGPSSSVPDLSGPRKVSMTSIMQSYKQPGTASDRPRCGRHFRVGIGTLIGSVAAYYGAVDEISDAHCRRIHGCSIPDCSHVSRPPFLERASSGYDRADNFGWMGYARVIRSEILRIREMDYVHAARSWRWSRRSFVLLVLH